MRVLLTGANGFIGKHFLQGSQGKFIILTASVRNHLPFPSLEGIDTVVHLGGKAHDMKETDDSLYFESNAELTRRLAEAAKAAGVRHFIYVSSVKVYGTIESLTLDESSPCRPDDAYGKSKLLAEQYLQQLADGQFIVSVVRPPLVYGAGVKGNMQTLVSLARKRIPVPLGNIRNRRSLVYVGNLVALVHRLIETKTPGIFIAGDREPLSTTRLFRLIKKYGDNRSAVVGLPLFCQWLVKQLRYSLYVRLFGSFVISNTNTNKQLIFQPPYATEQGIEAMVKGYPSSEA